MRFDRDKERIYCQGADNLYCIDCSDMSEVWNTTIGTGDAIHGQFGSGSYKYSRCQPMLINDSWTGNEAWIITQNRDDETMYAVDEHGNIEWTCPEITECRAMYAYHPDFGWIYANSVEADEIYAVNITNGDLDDTFDLSSVGFQCHSMRPMFVTERYLLAYTSNNDVGGSYPNYIFCLYANNGTMVDYVNVGNYNLRCDPTISSGGYTWLIHGNLPVCIEWGCGGHYYDYEIYGESPTGGFTNGNGFARYAIGDYEIPSGEGDISIKSINSESDGSVLVDHSRTFNWTKIDDTVYYNLQISNSSSFSNTFLDLSGINETNYGVNYTEKGDYVEFTLPYAYNVTYYGWHYYRVRAYILS
jgi:hypothetical protein